MKKLPILFTVVALFCSSALPKNVESVRSQEAIVKKWRSQNERKAYGYGVGEIKIANPADWIKNLEKPIFSGPQPGEKVPSFAATNLRGENAGEELNPVALAKD